MKSFIDIKNKNGEEYNNLIEKNVALISDSTSQLLAIGLKSCGYERGLDLKVFEFPYIKIQQGIDNIFASVINCSPDYVIINYSTQKVLDQYYNFSAEDRTLFYKVWLTSCEKTLKAIKNNIDCQILINNLTEIDDSIFGNFANKLRQSFKYQIRKINLNLMELSQDISNLHIADHLTLQYQYGSKIVSQPKFFYSSEIAFNIDFIPKISSNFLDIIDAMNGRFKKCLILDLDNTLWGGIIGDIGIENIEIGGLGIGKVFSDIQRWALELKQRGIILAVCSKNSEKLAKEPFIKHPDMILKLDDISVFIANRMNKAENIKSIKETLNIGYDSMVFIDDNQSERNIVSEIHPKITVPNLPSDPSEYLTHLQNLNLFETASFTSTDIKRHKQYQQEYQRVKRKFIHKDETEFLKSLGLTAKINELNDFNAPRASQLLQRSNQFNLRTIRYSINDLKKIIESSHFICFCVELSDKFGSYGLISVIILQKKYNELFIDNWVLSCRAFDRQVELLTMNYIKSFAKAKDYKFIKGQYIPTSKNEMVKDIYKYFGFKSKNDFWRLNLKDYKNKNCEILLTDHE